MENASREAACFVISLDVSRSLVHCDKRKKSPFGRSVSSKTSRGILSICRVCPPLFLQGEGDSVLVFNWFLYAVSKGLCF